MAECHVRYARLCEDRGEGAADAAGPGGPPWRPSGRSYQGLGCMGCQ